MDKVLDCEDCRQRSDLGNKCRACYKRWREARYADIPAALAEFQDVARDLRNMPRPDAHALALHIAGMGGAVRGHLAQLRPRVVAVLKGPFGAQLEAMLTNYRIRGESDGGNAKSLRAALRDNG